MLIFSVVIFVFSHMIYELFPNYVPRPPLPRKVGVMTPSSYGSAAPVNMKKRSETVQTLHTGCSKAEPEIFLPAADPIPGGAGWPKFNHLDMVTTFTYRPSLVKIDAHNFELSW